jgi:hypothetical protein
LIRQPFPGNGSGISKIFFSEGNFEKRQQMVEKQGGVDALVKLDARNHLRIGSDRKLLVESFTASP